ncbi:MAG: hypothetical protein ACJ8G3_10240 [Burkholderiaceae bacterium]
MKKFIGLPTFIPPSPECPAAIMGATIAAVLLQQWMTATILAARPA